MQTDKQEQNHSSQCNRMKDCGEENLLEHPYHYQQSSQNTHSRNSFQQMMPGNLDTPM